MHAIDYPHLRHSEVGKQGIPRSTRHAPWVSVFRTPACGDIHPRQSDVAATRFPSQHSLNSPDSASLQWGAWSMWIHVVICHEKQKHRKLTHMLARVYSTDVATATLLT